MLADLRAFGDEDWETGLLPTVFKDVTGNWPVLGTPTSATSEEESVTAVGYPNPFNSSAIIRYSLGVEGPVRLTIYDMLGRQIAVLANEKRQAGEHTAYFDASDLRSGVYIYHIETVAGTVSGTLHLVK